MSGPNEFGQRLRIAKEDRVPLLCALIGCESVFARWFRWPHRICSWWFLGD